MKSTGSIFLVRLLLALQPLPAAGMLTDGAPLVTRLGDPVSVPAEIVGHAMYVNVMINDHGPFRFLLDTGCSFTLVSPGVAEAVGAVAGDQDDDYVAARNGLGDTTEVEPVALTTGKVADTLLLIGALEIEAGNVRAAVHLTIADLHEVDAPRDLLVHSLVGVE